MIAIVINFERGILFSKYFIFHMKNLTHFILKINLSFYLVISFEMIQQFKFNYLFKCHEHKQLYSLNNTLFRAHHIHSKRCPRKQSISLYILIFYSLNMLQLLYHTLRNHLPTFYVYIYIYLTLLPHTIYIYCFDYNIALGISGNI